ncbi:NAD(P)/FAD-dependent oxidoreductase [Candidatus Dependentiae bacterium]|nr:NAD(P)/FAD-dependent oxidoreductase [Candidatus Dependentiae bacterium]
MSTIIIIGASAAGIATASKLRDFDHTARIICITKENTMPYNRCLLADFLGGSRSIEQVRTKGQHFFTEKNIDLLLGCEVIKLDTEKQVVTTKNQSMVISTLKYDAVVIATGRSAFVPSPLNTSIPGIFPFYDLSHTADIVQHITTTNAKKALVVGAGITGLECTDALLHHNLEITLVERNAQILARQIDKDGASFLEELITRKGVSIHLNTTIENLELSTALDKKKSSFAVTLSNGHQLETDIIIAATGGKQNLAFAKEADITCDEFGIITDDLQRTNVSNVFAAGDVCSVINLASNKRTCSTLWPDAVAQGLTVANSIVGASKPYQGTLNITSTNIFGTTLVTCGDFSALDSCDKLSKNTADFYHRFYLQDGILQSFVMVGNVGSVGQLRKAIIEKLRIN